MEQNIGQEKPAGPASHCLTGAEKLSALSREVREIVQETVGELVGCVDPEDKNCGVPTPSSLLGRIEECHGAIMANLHMIREEIKRL